MIKSAELIQIVDLGCKSYKEVWDLQKDLFNRIIEEKSSGLTPKMELLFVEHPPVYTMGRNGNQANLLMGSDFLKKIGAEYYNIERGGDITFHGPGQLVGYPIIDLETLGLGIKDYIYTIEKSIIDTLNTFNIQCEIYDGAVGVWIDSNGQNARKICAIGVKVSKFITMHGFALNVNTDLNYFNYINPCGFTDKSVTSIEKELGKQISLDIIKERFSAFFFNNLDSISKNNHTT